MTQEACQHVVLLMQLWSQRLDLLTMEVPVEVSTALQASRPAPEPLLRPGGSPQLSCEGLGEALFPRR